MRRSVESANAQTQGQIESRNDALVSLESEVARTYSQLRGAQSIKQITLAEIDAEEQILDLTREHRANDDVENEQLRSYRFDRAPLRVLTRTAGS